jgi:chemotaxis protein methyltransferase CheR
MNVTTSSTLSDSEFQSFRNWLHQVAGISMSPAKKPLLGGRLQKRLRDLNLRSFAEYYRLVTTPGESEAQIAIDLLTTNETWFFREPKHFEFLRDQILPSAPRGQAFRVWSAASSTGEEPYSIAMTLAEARSDSPWEILASDLSTRVLAKAAAGHYAMERAEHIPKPFLQKYCLKGVGKQNGTFLIHPDVKRHMHFEQINLNNNLPDTGNFDVIFLRNVMI